MGGIRKERLELFSDGVFAIILTLLVLDLKVPEQLGFAGLQAAAPGLLVHAGAFFVIGMAWITHHQFLEHMERISTTMLGSNLLVLFWITLVPYGARIAAERPHDGLGAAIMTVSVTLSMASTLLMIKTGHFTSPAHDPVMIQLRKRRFAFFLAYVAVGLVVTALCFVSPWFGFAFLTIGLAALFVRPVSEAHARMSGENVG